MRLRRLGIGLVMLGAMRAGVGQAPGTTAAMRAHFGHGTPPLSAMVDMAKKPYRVPPLHGHWTLLYFWADWCVPCVQEGMPALMRFSQQHAAEAKRFQIVAIRFNSMQEAGDWTTFHAKTERLERTVWHGTPLFPVVYDASTRMTTEWGVHQLPTYALIDPEGNLVRGGDLTMLEREIGRQGR